MPTTTATSLPRPARRRIWPQSCCPCWCMRCCLAPSPGACTGKAAPTRPPSPPNYGRLRPGRAPSNPPRRQQCRQQSRQERRLRRPHPARPAGPPAAPPAAPAAAPTARPDTAPAPQPPDTRVADIAIEREKKRQERERQEAQRRERLKKKKEAEQRAKQLAEQEKQKKLAQDKLRAEQAAKSKAQAQAQEQEQRLARQREDNLRRLQGLAGASGGDNGAALRSAGPPGPSGSYSAKVSAKVRPNIVYPDAIAGNPRAEVEVRLSPDGTIVGKRLLQPSTSKAWDDAVLRALDKTETLPRDVDGRVPPSLVIGFRPQD